MSECENTDESFEFLSQAEIDQVRNTKKGMMKCLICMCNGVH